VAGCGGKILEEDEGLSDATSTVGSDALSSVDSLAAETLDAMGTALAELLAEGALRALDWAGPSMVHLEAVLDVGTFLAAQPLPTAEGGLLLSDSRAQSQKSTPRDGPASGPSSGAASAPPPLALSAANKGAHTAVAHTSGRLAGPQGEPLGHRGGPTVAVEAADTPAVDADARGTWLRSPGSDAGLSVEVGACPRLLAQEEGGAGRSGRGAAALRELRFRAAARLRAEKKEGGGLRSWNCQVMAGILEGEGAEVGCGSL
ncbi:hypothetical protein T484DRAFT_1785459, partial [Baffinella frigidus]